MRKAINVFQHFLRALASLVNRFSSHVDEPEDEDEQEDSCEREFFDQECPIIQFLQLVYLPDQTYCEQQENTPVQRFCPPSMPGNSVIRRHEFFPLALSIEVFAFRSFRMK